MTWYTLRRESIDRFKRQWPCHGLPDNLESISAEFASNGELVDIEAFDDCAVMLDTHEFDGPALVALVDDTRKLGDVSR